MYLSIWGFPLESGVQIIVEVAKDTGGLDTFEKLLQVWPTPYNNGNNPVVWKELAKELDTVERV